MDNRLEVGYCDRQDSIAAVDAHQGHEILVPSYMFLAAKHHRFSREQRRIMDEQLAIRSQLIDYT